MKKYSFPYKGAIIIFIALIIIGAVILNINKPSETIVKEALSNYIISQDELEDRKFFAEATIFKIKKTFNKIYVYAWITEESYYLENNRIFQDDTFSKPYRFTISYKNKKVEVIKAETPQVGSNYQKEYNKLFPLLLRHKIVEPNISLKEEAVLYFKDKITND